MRRIVMMSVCLAAAMALSGCATTSGGSNPSLSSAGGNAGEWGCLGGTVAGAVADYYLDRGFAEARTGHSFSAGSSLSCDASQATAASAPAVKVKRGKKATVAAGE